ncbi:hypothetical protein PsW64_04753 [Pseudovibrio sp. W64]|uniref:DUF3800 domain-containing protein n=1 Tax=Pseudovibrio sp. W64 TaxID=1735583 RepID=UPI0007B1ACA6|nr:DUF3800 domain-containing protein [Pseudovibrio sp. W64]KZK76908.1 hypothetical protein PsW64_04753 [Pseudovibrio sp. W64]
MTKYLLVIDESGEAGIARFRSADGAGHGASPYMSLGAALIPCSRIDKFREELERIKAALKVKDLHCRDLNHPKKVYLARQISQLVIQCFGVLSYKPTLKSYAESIETNAHMFYNKCCKYLLERVGEALIEHGISSENVQIIFEEGNFEYEKLKNFVRACQRKPLHENAKFLKAIDPDQISAVAKEDESLLQIADLVAHALFSTVNKSRQNFKIPESRYLYELRHRFYADEDGLIMNKGIKLIHKIADLGLDPDIAEFYQTLNSKK